MNIRNEFCTSESMKMFQQVTYSELIKFKHLTFLPPGGHGAGHSAGDGHGAVRARAPDGPEPA